MKRIHKILVFLAGVALLMSAAAVVALSFWSFGRIEEAAEARKHTSLVINNANELLLALIDVETGERGYLLTGDEAFLGAYWAVRDSIGGKLERLRQLTSIGAARQHLDTLAPLIKVKLAYFSHNIELRRNHDLDAALVS